jgi:hypothetical protein
MKKETLGNAIFCNLGNINTVGREERVGANVKIMVEDSDRVKT